MPSLYEQLKREQSGDTSDSGSGGAKRPKRRTSEQSGGVYERLKREQAQATTEEDAQSQARSSRSFDFDTTPASPASAVFEQDNIAGDIENEVNETIQRTQQDTDTTKKGKDGLFTRYKNWSKRMTNLLGETVVDLTEDAVTDTRDVWTEGIKNIKDLRKLEQAQRDEALIGTAEGLKEGAQAFGTGVWDTFTKTAPKTVTTILSAGADNLKFGVYVPGKGVMEPEFVTRNREKAADFFAEVSDYITRQQRESAEEAGVGEGDSIFDPRRFGYGTGSGIASLGLSVITGGATKSSMVAGSLLGAMEGSDTYWDSIDKISRENPDMSEEEVEKRAAGLFLVDSAGIAILEKYGLDALMRARGSTWLARRARNAVTETIQEDTQTVWSNAVARYGYDSERALLEDFFETTIQTPLVGFFGGGGAEIASDTQVVDDIADDLEKNTKLDKQGAKEMIEKTMPVVDEIVRKDMKTEQRIRREEEGLNNLERDIQEALETQSPEEVANNLSEELGIEESEAQDFVDIATRDLEVSEEATQELDSLIQEVEQELEKTETKEETSEIGREELLTIASEKGFNDTNELANLADLRDALQREQSETNKELANLVDDLSERSGEGQNFREVMTPEEEARVEELNQQFDERSFQLDAVLREMEREDTTPSLQQEFGNESLSEQERTVETQAFRRIQENQDEVIGEYVDIAQEESPGEGVVINTDLARSLFTDDLTRDSNAVHEPSSYLTDVVYEQVLERLSEEEDASKQALFTTGGTAVGKSSGIEDIRDLNDVAKSANVIYDTTGRNYDSLLRKIQKALDKGVTVDVVGVIGEPIKSTRIALKRAAKTGRTVPTDVIVRSHAGSRESLLNLLEQDMDGVNVTVVDNSGDVGESYVVDNPVDFLQERLYDKDEIEALINQANDVVQQTLEENQIREEIARAFTGESQQRAGRGVREESEQESEGRTRTQSLEELEGELQEVYANQENAERELAEILVGLEIAEPGQNIFEDGEFVERVPSTFPDWIPDDVRTSDYVGKALELIAEPSEVQYPTNPRASRQREMVDALLNELDQRLAIDTSEIRGNILEQYGEQETLHEPTITQEEDSQSGEGSEERGQAVSEEEVGDDFDAIDADTELFKLRSKDIFNYSRDELTEMSDEQITDELGDLNEEEMDALVFSEQGNIIFNELEESLPEEVQRIYAGHLQENNLNTTNYDAYSKVTTNVLEALEDKTTAAKDYVRSKLNEVHKNVGVKKSERELIESTLDEFEGDRVDIAEFKDRLRSKILPLQIQGINAPILSWEEARELERKAQRTGNNEDWRAYEEYVETLEAIDLGRGERKRDGRMAKYGNVVLDDSRRGDVSQYDEHIFESPIQTRAGDEHGFNTENYFAHARIEDMADGNTRRVIEVQSDLFQRGRLEKEMPAAFKISNININLQDKRKREFNIKRQIDQLEEFIEVVLKDENFVADYDPESPASSIAAATHDFIKNSEKYQTFSQRFDDTIDQAFLSTDKATLKQIEERIRAKIREEEAELSDTIERIQALEKKKETVINENFDDLFSEEFIEEQTDKFLKEINEDSTVEGTPLTREKAREEAVEQLKDDIARLKEVSQLAQYRNNWWERILREEARQAAIDGKTKMLLPKGKTIMRIEGLSAVTDDTALFFDRFETYEARDELDVGSVVELNGENFMLLTEDPRKESALIAKVEDINLDIEVWAYIKEQIEAYPGIFESYVEVDENDIDVTTERFLEAAIEHEDGAVAFFEEVLGNIHNLEVVLSDTMPWNTPKELGQETMFLLEEPVWTVSVLEREMRNSGMMESDVNTDHPIYKFYEKDVAGFLEKNFENVSDVTDENGVGWTQVEITPEMAEQPVVAYKMLSRKLKNASDIVRIKAERDDVPFDMSADQAQKWLSMLFGKGNVDFVPFDAETTDKDYWGVYSVRKWWKKPRLEFATFRGQAQSRIVYHEAFHGAFRQFLTAEEQRTLINNAKNSIPARFTQEVERLARRGDERAEEAYFSTDKRAEEWLANDFAKYYEWEMQMRENKAHALENESLYEKLLRKIREWVRKAIGAQEVYEMIVERVDEAEAQEANRELNEMIIENAGALEEFRGINMNSVLEVMNGGRNYSGEQVEELYDTLKDDYNAYEQGDDTSRAEVVNRFYKQIDDFKKQGEVEQSEEQLFKIASDKINEFTVREETRPEASRRVLQDLNARIDNVQKQLLEQGAVINEESDVFLAKTLLPRRIGAKFNDLKERIEKPFIESLVNSGLTIEDMDRYAHALHAPRRNEIMRDQRDYDGNDGSGMTNKEAEAIIQEYRDNGKLPSLERHRERLREVQKTINAFQLDNGLISREELKAWYRIYGQDYVPLKRSVPSKEAGIFGRGVDVRGKESKRAKGSSREVLPITAQIFNQYRHAVMRSEHNKVAQTLYNFIVENNENGEMDGLFNVFRQQYVPRYDKDGELEYMDPSYVNDPSVIGLKIDGKQYYIEIKDEKYARALNEKGLKDGFAVSGRFVGFLSSMITQYSPEFAVRNLMRDFFEGMINVQEIIENEFSSEQARGLSRNVGRGTFGMIKELFKYETGKETDRADLFDRFKKAGGEVGYFWSVNIEQAMADLEKLQSQYENEGFERVKNKVRTFGEYIDAMNTSVELAVRVSLFEQLTERGMSDKKAAAYAGDLTVDFNKMGEWGPFMKSLWVFINPAIQGPARMYRAMRNSKRVKAATFAMFGAGFLNGLFSMMMGGEGDDDIPEYVKNTRISFALPNNDVATLFYLPYGYNAFWAAGRNVAEMIMERRTASETVTDTLTASLDSFSPLGGTRLSITALIPEGTLIKPFIEIQLNQAWHGGPIMPEQPPFEPKVPDSQRYWDSVSDTSKYTAQFINKITGGNERESGFIDVSPESIDYAVSSYGGTVSTLINNSFGSITNLVSGDEVKKQHIPFVRDFWRDIDTKRAKQQIIYPMLDESARTQYGEVKTQRYMNAVDTLLEIGELDEGYAEKLKTDFKENQVELETGMGTEENAIQDALQRVNTEGVSRGEAFRDVLREVAGDNPESREITSLKKKFKLHDTFGFNDPLVERLEEGSTNDEKARILVQMKSEMSESEFRDFFRKARSTVTTASGRKSHVLISDDLLKKYRRELQSSQ